MLLTVNVEHHLNGVIVVLQEVVVGAHQASFVPFVDELGTLLMFVMANMAIPLAILSILVSPEFLDLKPPILFL